MTLRKSGKHYYGDSQDDIRDEILRYSQLNENVAQHFANAICACGTRTFRLLIDDNEGAGVRICNECNNKHPIGDSREFLEDASLEECACPCGAESFEITIGVSLYDNSEDVKWLYVGCRCSTCSLTAVYGDWKNELIGYRELLTRV
jgi:hypothetical protein